MPKAIDLKVNNGATTPVEKTFTLITPAAGDNSLAQWALKEGAIGTQFPRFTAVAGRTPRGRNLKLKLRIPMYYTDVATGQILVGDYFEFNGTYSVPEAYLESMKNDAVAFSVNLPNTPLIKEMIRDALAAT